METNKKKVIKYKGYYIDCYKTYPDKITVQMDGDDVVFASVEDAKAAIDECFLP